jgi:hypothetical protein
MAASNDGDIHAPFHSRKHPADGGNVMYGEFSFAFLLKCTQLSHSVERMQHLYDTAAFWGDKVLSWTVCPSHFLRRLLLTRSQTIRMTRFGSLKHTS